MERYERFYNAMMAVDPTIKIIANGQDLRWDKPDAVRLRESDLKMDSAELSYSVPAHSIVLLSFDRKEG